VHVTENRSVGGSIPPLGTILRSKIKAIDLREIFCRSFLGMCAAVLFCGVVATAQDYPLRAVRIIVPLPLSGSNDIIVRIVAQKLSERCGQTFTVENRGGAGGNIGAEAVASADADGYTLLLTAPPPLTINATLYKKLPFDPVKAFAPVALIASVPIVMVVNPSLPIKNVSELIALAKAKPGTLADHGLAAEPAVTARLGAAERHLCFVGSGFAGSHLVQ
jgi:tripartite-type tricarboxylate transporter receptor subunit TctC